MPLFLIITKILLLKIFLTQCYAYEYGYHPSDEEFDNFMRDPERTWTRDILANERRSAWYKPKIIQSSPRDSMSDNNIRIGEYFVPKYHYEKQRQSYETTLNLKWPGSTEKTQRKPRPIRQYDQQSAASSSTTMNIIRPHGDDDDGVGSNFNFQMFNDEMNYPENPEKLSSTVGPLKFTPTKISHGTIIQIENDLSDQSGNSQTTKPSTTTPITTLSKWTSKYSLNNLYKNNSDAKFPIFFTNPVTSIVYAITEIGNVNQQQHFIPNPNSKTNHSISIYITKEQYDHDMQALKETYETQCSGKKKIVSSTNRPIASANLLPTNTQRPQIVRSKRPTTTFKPSIIKQSPKPSPSPVKVQTSVTISDQVRPLKRPNKIKNKKKKKKRPGRKPSQNTTPQRPSMSEGTLPQIFKGRRTTTTKPLINKDKFITQLERPSLPSTTIFSSQPIASTSGYVLPKKEDMIQQSSNPYRRHRLSKRSLPNQKLEFISPSTTQAPNIPSLPRPTVAKGQRLIFTNSSTLGSRSRNITVRLVRKWATNTSENPIKSQIIKPDTKTTLKRNRNKRRKGTKRGQNNDDDDDDFDLLELFDDEDDQDSDYYYYDEIKKKTTKQPKTKLPEYSASESVEDAESPSSSSLKEPLPHNNSSSEAEEGADFGALEEYDFPVEEQHEPTPELLEDFSTERTKTTSAKKRIRRRPTPTASDEDYNDDADDDSGGGGGAIGDFFRMLFYPVQVVMGRVVDTFTGPGDDSNEEINDKLIYPTYTQYSGMTNTAAADNDDENENDQSYSFSSWFSSLFGFNRRTKKIGSTTAAPPPVPAETAEASGWFDSWFGFGGDKTTSTEAATSNEDYDDYDKWFSSWFGTKPKAKRRISTTTTTAATVPQVPILTIVDPMRNPQNWLGILAHHIINSTTTTTHNPLLDMLTRTTTTATTANPDVPHFISYDKYQIWRLKPQNEGHVRALEDYKRTDEGAKLQWLKGPSLRGLTDVLVPPKMQIDFQATLQFESIAHEILIFDVGKAIAYEQTKEQFYLTTPRPQKLHQQQKHKYASLINMSWNKYYNYDDIVKFLESVRMRHPQIVELFHIGRSYEGRPLVVVKLEMKSSSDTSNAGTLQSNHKKLRHKKKSGHASAIFIEAGTHGLEWIGPATATWMINEILRIMKSNKTTNETDFIRKTTWYIMPVLNPDGYSYSHEYDRFWRKSRSRHVSRPGGLINSAMVWLQQKKVAEKVCYGVDLDRNWHYQWGRRGSSKSPCNELYAGPASFSEPETKALSEFLMDNRKQIKLYISMQAYGQIISYPSKVNASFETERLEDFMDVALAGIDGLRKKGNKSRYKIDSANDLIEQRAGSSDAFAAYEVGIPFSYTLYLADNGVHGYLLPSSSIETTARDSFEIILSMLDYI